MLVGLPMTLDNMRANSVRTFAARPRPRLILIALIFLVMRSGCALAVERQFLTPDTTTFTFSSESKGSNKFCNLLVSAVKVPGAITLNAVAARLGPGDQNMVFGYEIKAFESKIQRGRVSEPQALKIKDASISSDIFSSKGSVERAQVDAALYAINGSTATISNFTTTIIKGTYNVNVELSDGRNMTYVIEGDISLLDAAEKWTKCTIQIAQ
jgi:hypothetical protein